MNIALFGGSFDPPHFGHIQIVLAALSTLEIDKLIIVPAYRNPLKDSICANGMKRIEWLKTIFKSYPKVEISDFEVSQNRPVYTIETVLHYKTATDKIFLILGADNVEKLSQWHQFDLLKNEVTFVVATRDNHHVPTDMITLKINEPISSTLFRNSFDSLGLEETVENEIITYYKENYESTN